VRVVALECAALGEVLRSSTMSTTAALGDIANARARALKAVKAACGNSIDAQFYAKRILDRYELVMQEHGFGYQVLVDNTESLQRPDDEAGWSEPASFQPVAGFFAASPGLGD
jgi:hypothetical protein